MNKKILLGMVLAWLLMFTNIPMPKTYAATIDGEGNSLACSFSKKLIEGKWTISVVLPSILPSDGEKAGLTRGNLVDLIETKYSEGNIESIKNANGEEITENSAFVGTGSTITLIDKTEVTVILYGDVSGDGKVNELDSLIVLKYDIGERQIENEANKIAGTLVKDENSDTSKIGTSNAMRILYYSIDLLGTSEETGITLVDEELYPEDINDLSDIIEDQKEKTIVDLDKMLDEQVKEVPENEYFKTTYNYGTNTINVDIRQRKVGISSIADNIDVLKIIQNLSNKEEIKNIIITSEGVEALTINKENATIVPNILSWLNTNSSKLFGKESLDDVIAGDLANKTLTLTINLSDNVKLENEESAKTYNIEFKAYPIQVTLDYGYAEEGQSENKKEYVTLENAGYLTKPENPIREDVVTTDENGNTKTIKYKFLGWYYEKIGENGQTIQEEMDFEKGLIVDNITLYAKWAQEETTNIDLDKIVENEVKEVPENEYFKTTYTYGTDKINVDIKQRKVGISSIADNIDVLKIIQNLSNKEEIKNIVITSEGVEALTINKENVATIVPNILNWLNTNSSKLFGKESLDDVIAGDLANKTLTFTINLNDNVKLENGESAKIYNIEFKAYPIQVTLDYGYAEEGQNENKKEYVTLENAGKLTQPNTPTRKDLVTTDESGNKKTIKYKFLGWYFEQTNGEGQVVEQKMDFENNIIVDNVTLYAKWEEETLIEKTTDLDSIIEAEIKAIQENEYFKITYSKGTDLINVDIKKRSAGINDIATKINVLDLIRNLCGKEEIESIVVASEGVEELILNKENSTSLVTIIDWLERNSLKLFGKENLDYMIAGDLANKTITATINLSNNVKLENGQNSKTYKAEFKAYPIQVTLDYGYAEEGQSENKKEYVTLENAGKLTQPNTPTRKDLVTTDESGNKKTIKYKFLGWYFKQTNGEGQVVEQKMDFENNIIVDNVTLYAKWTQEETIEPAKPGDDPNVPDDPSVPSDPSVPDDPNIPDDPSIPDDPGTPENPTEPTEPAEEIDPVNEILQKNLINSDIYGVEYANNNLTFTVKHSNQKLSEIADNSVFKAISELIKNDKIQEVTLRQGNNNIELKTLLKDLNYSEDAIKELFIKYWSQICSCTDECCKNRNCNWNTATNNCLINGTNFAFDVKLVDTAVFKGSKDNERTYTVNFKRDTVTVNFHYLDPKKTVESVTTLEGLPLSQDILKDKKVPEYSEHEFKHWCTSEQLTTQYVFGQNNVTSNMDLYGAWWLILDTDTDIKNAMEEAKNTEVGNIFKETLNIVSGTNANNIKIGMKSSTDDITQVLKTALFTTLLDKELSKDGVEKIVITYTPNGGVETKLEATERNKDVVMTNLLSTMSGTTVTISGNSQSRATISNSTLFALAGKKLNMKVIYDESKVKLAANKTNTSNEYNITFERLVTHQELKGYGSSLMEKYLNPHQSQGFISGRIEGNNILINAKNCLNEVAVDKIEGSGALTSLKGFLNTDYISSLYIYLPEDQNNGVSINAEDLNSTWGTYKKLRKVFGKFEDSTFSQILNMKVMIRIDLAENCVWDEGEGQLTYAIMAVNE